MQEYDEANSETVNIEKFIGRIEREINKYSVI